MPAPTCCECKQRRPLSQFFPRQNTTHKGHAATPRAAEDVWRQPRCSACNKARLSRAHFMKSKLVPLAKSLGIKVSTKNRSAHRKLLILSDSCATQFLAELEALCQAFNDALSGETADSMLHGIELAFAPEHCLVQAELFPVTSVGC